MNFEDGPQCFHFTLAFMWISFGLNKETNFKLHRTVQHRISDPYKSYKNENVRTKEKYSYLPAFFALILPKSVQSAPSLLEEVSYSF